MDDTKINLDNVTFSDLRIHYRTGRAYLIRQEGRTKTYGYRKGMQTDLGDLEENTWVQLVSGLIQTSGEQQLQKDLLEWEQEHNYCHNSRKEMEIHVLELYTDRIFDNPLWVDYIPFNRKYRPEVWPLPSWFGFKRNAAKYLHRSLRNSWRKTPVILTGFPVLFVADGLRFTSAHPRR